MWPTGQPHPLRTCESVSTGPVARSVAGVFIAGRFDRNAVPERVDSDTVRGWIDDDLVDDVERIPDDVAEFNFAVDMSNILVHVLRREPDGPLIIGQEVAYDEGIRARIRDLSGPERNALVARIRETLAAAPVVYGFHDDRGNNVRFEDVQRLFLEYRLYPDALSQHELMTGLVDVWKALRYVDDVVGLVDAVER